VSFLALNAVVGGLHPLGQPALFVGQVACADAGILQALANGAQLFPLLLTLTGELLNFLAGLVVFGAEFRGGLAGAFELLAQLPHLLLRGRQRGAVVLDGAVHFTERGNVPLGTLQLLDFLLAFFRALAVPVDDALISSAAR